MRIVRVLLVLSLLLIPAVPSCQRSKERTLKLAFYQGNPEPRDIVLVLNGEEIVSLLGAARCFDNLLCKDITLTRTRGEETEIRIRVHTRFGGVIDSSPETFQW